jgi:superfamily II DNA/RNA helicase
MPGFTDLEGLTLTDTIARAMVADHIAHPTPAQRDAIPPILAGQHVLIHTGTGTGKTLAYLLPVLQRLRETEGRAVVFAPGAELAMQTLRVANAYKDASLTTGAAIATSNQRRQRKRIQKSTRLVVGTPDRLLELFSSGKLKGVRIMVLDELDPILTSRGASFLSELLTRSEPKVQLIVATATLAKRSVDFIARFMDDCVRVEAGASPMQGAIAHHLVPVPPRKGREVVLARLVREHRIDRVIVFASESRHHGHLFHYLREHDITAVTLSRDRTKRQREQALRAFRAGEARVLLTTDSAARGIDVPAVDWVVHYDLPRAAQAYVHRAGRTGRAGREGRSVVLAGPSERGALKRFAKELGIAFGPLPRR